MDNRLHEKALKRIDAASLERSRWGKDSSFLSKQIQKENGIGINSTRAIKGASFGSNLGGELKLFLNLKKLH